MVKKALLLAVLLCGQACIAQDTYKTPKKNYMKIAKTIGQNALKTMIGVGTGLLCTFMQNGMSKTATGVNHQNMHQYVTKTVYPQSIQDFGTLVAISLSCMQLEELARKKLIVWYNKYLHKNKQSDTNAEYVDLIGSYIGSYAPGYL